MIELRNLRHKSEVNYDNIHEFKTCISELLDNPYVQSMDNFIQHSDVSTLEHCLSVSFVSYVICKRLKLNYIAGARGGLLHDFYLYDWHDTKPSEGIHGFVHSRIALENAQRYFQINEREQDIIVKHMYPLTLKSPRYLESWIVTIVDKWITIEEVLKYKGVSPLVYVFRRKNIKI